MAIAVGSQQKYKLPPFTTVPQYYFDRNSIVQQYNGNFLFDIECYPNYFLIAFKSFDTGYVWQTDATGENALPTDDIVVIRWLLQHTMLIGYNCANYDIPMLFAAIKGLWPSQLKAISDYLIVGDNRPYQAEEKFKFKIGAAKFIDLQPVGPNPVNEKQRISLKHYGARAGARRLQELPYHPDQVLSQFEINKLREYCVNDLDVTGTLRYKLSDQIELRKKLGFKYGTNLLAKSDAQVAEAVISAEIEKRQGYRPRAPRVEAGKVFKYEPPKWINFYSKPMQDLFWHICGMNLKVNQWGNIETESLPIKVPYKGSTYTVGLGGLHSTEKQVAHYKTDDTLIIDRDVESYYPNIILNEGWYPKHIGPDFLTIYRELKETRIRAKKAKDKVTSDSLKIVINGTFGKTSNRFSCIYDPWLMIHITLTGQLALLMLIEMMEWIGIPVVSANTDGIVMKCPKNRYDDLNQIIHQWESITGFVTEETQYDALLTRDVNNYFAIKSHVDEGDPKFKTTGIYHSSLSLSDKSPQWLKNNLSNTIVNEAIKQFVLTRNNKRPIKIETTINKCKDVLKFLRIQQVRGGAVKDQQYLGKVVRFYMAKNDFGSINYAKSGNTVANSQGAIPLLEIPNELPKDIDLAWYVDESYRQLRDLGFYGSKPEQKNLFD